MTRPAAGKATRNAAAVLVATMLVCATPIARAVDLHPRGPTDVGWRVQRVVDGDTISVTRAGQRLRVRLLGIDSPETVRPDSPVECFGPQATAFARQALEGRVVTLEFDPSQGLRDRFGRTLAYVWTNDPSPRLFNREAVATGMAREYTYAGRPYAWQREFRLAQAQAKGVSLGLWGACPLRP